MVLWNDRFLTGELTDEEIVVLFKQFGTDFYKRMQLEPKTTLKSMRKVYLKKKYKVLYRHGYI